MLHFMHYLSQGLKLLVTQKNNKMKATLNPVRLSFYDYLIIFDYFES